MDKESISNFETQLKETNALQYQSLLEKLKDSYNVDELSKHIVKEFIDFIS